MSTNQISPSSYQVSSGPSVIGAIGSSLLNVGLTVGAGAAAGGAAGKIASLIPSKPSEAALEHQYKDMFQKAARNTEELPKYLENMEAGAKEIIKDIIKRGQGVNVAQNAKNAEFATVMEIAQTAAAHTDETIKAPEVQEQIKNLFKDAAVPTGGYEKAGIKQRLDKMAETIGAASETNKATLGKIEEEFVSKVKGQGFENIQELAKDGAKHLRKTTLIGAGIGVGVFVALAINLFNSFGSIGKKYMSKGQQGQAAGGFSTQA